MEDLVNTYRPKSGLILPPSVVGRLKKRSDLEFSLRAPSTMLMQVGEDGRIVCEDGFLSLGEVMSKLGKRCMPAFVVDSLAVATSLTASLKLSRVWDCFIATSDIVVAQFVKAQLEFVRTIWLALGESDPGQLRDKTNISDSRIVITSESVTQKDTQYLLARGITVWQIVQDDRVSIFSGIAKGVNGIVAYDYSLCYDCIESCDKVCFSRAPYMVAHRGCSSLAHENTLASMRKALAVNADIIECDYYITLDGVPIIMHDRFLTEANFVGITDKVNIEDLTYLELSKLLFRQDTSQHIPTLEQFLSECKDKDVLHYIELKSEKPEAVFALRRLIDKYDVSQQVVIIAFGNTDGLRKQLRLIRNILPEISLGYLTCDDLDLNFAKIHSQFNCSYNAYFTMYNNEFLRNLFDRGIMTFPWSYTNPVNFTMGLSQGIYALTTNYPQWGGALATSFVADNKYQIGRTKSTARSVIAYLTRRSGGEKAHYACELVPIDTNVELHCEGQKYYAVGTDGFYAYLRGSFTLELNEPNLGEAKFDYCMMSEPVFVTVK